MKRSTSESIKPLAPYGAILEQYIKSNVPVNFAPYLFVGNSSIIDCRNSLSAGIPALCLPPGESINTYRWSVQGLKIVLYNSGGVSLDDMKRMGLYLLTIEDVSFLTIFMSDTSAVLCYRNERYYPDHQPDPMRDH